jgi:hypothetical protein
MSWSPVRIDDEDDDVEDLTMSPFPITTTTTTASSLYQLQSDLDLLVSIFPDCKPEYITEQLQKEFKNQNRVQVITNLLIENKGYPKRLKVDTNDKNNDVDFEELKKKLYYDITTPVSAQYIGTRYTFLPLVVYFSCVLLIVLCYVVMYMVYCIRLHCIVVCSTGIHTSSSCSAAVFANDFPKLNMTYIRSIMKLYVLLFVYFIHC